MKTERYIGVSFIEGRIQVAEVEHGKKVSVTALAEHESNMDFAQAGSKLSADHPQLATFVGELRNLYKQQKLKAEYISFALPPDPVFINILPIDNTLKGPELTKHLQWELSQYAEGGSHADYVLDSHALPSSGGNARPTFMVAVRKGMIAFIQKAIAELRLTLNIIDIDQFSTEKTLLVNYPEILAHDIVLVGLRYSGVDASLIHEGQMTDYRGYAFDGTNDPKPRILDYLKYLKDRSGVESPAALLLHGMTIPPTLVKELRSESGIKQTLPLNALRKLPVSAKIYEPFVKESFRFASAIGTALRAR